jgi:hypothetical protein
MGFQVSDKVKKIMFGLIGLGVILLVLGFFTQKRYLFPTYVDSHTLTVMSNYEGDFGDTKALIDEVKTSLGDDYVVTVEDVTPKHDDHTDGETHEGGHVEGDNHTHGEVHHDHNAPKLLWHIHIAHKEHAASHEGEAHSGGHKTETHSVMPHASHGGGHHGVDPAAEITAKFESGELSLADSTYRRFWSNLLVNGFFFFGITIGAMFYLGLHYATESGWGVVILRVIEGVASAMPMGIGILAVVFLAASFGLNHIYPWMDQEVVNNDTLIYNKSSYLNIPFFLIRAVAYFAVFLFFMNWFRKTSRKEDEEGGVDIHFKMYRRSAVFLVFFAVFSSTMAWDFIMSIDTHWFSTLFGWYSFAGIWLSAMITVMMFTLYLKGKGALEYVNENHIHDIAKWMFALSFLWSYLWFSQFMLIWYSNIPEEVQYFIYRFEDYRYLFLGMFAVNFILPMVFFMSRDTKRSWPYLIFIGLVIFIGHWFDVFCMVMPGTLFSEWEYGMLEIGMFMTFLGTFVLLIFRGLSKSPLIQKNHPYLQESIHHEF